MGMRAAKFWRSRKRRWLVAVAAVTVAIGIARWWTHESGPSYEGESLTDWLTNPEERPDAPDAVRQMGTNALPTLLTWIQYEPSPWRGRFDQLSHPAPDWVRDRHPENAMTLAKGVVHWRPAIHGHAGP